jgi:hypothetical protein
MRSMVVDKRHNLWWLLCGSVNQFGLGGGDRQSNLNLNFWR